MAFHCELTDLDIHVINTWTYANSAAREAATGFTSDDVYKVAVQSDDNSLWILIDEAPITWMQVGGVVVGDISHCDLDNLLVDCHTQYMPTNASRAFTQPVCGAPPTIGAHLATKAYVDGEVVSDHGDLTGLLDVEDHPDYSTLDGARAYTAPVTGVDPTLDNHLATKLYTLAVSANALAQALAADIDTFTGLTDTPSGYSGKSLQLVRVNAGETALEFAPSGTGGGTAELETEYATSEGVSSTTSSSYQQKLRLTTSSLVAGTYMIQYSWEFDGDNEHGWSRAQLNDTTDLNEDRYDSSQVDYIMISGFAIEALSGVNTIDIDFRANSGGDTMLIRRARIALWRIS